MFPEFILKQTPHYNRSPMIFICFLFYRPQNLGKSACFCNSLIVLSKLCFSSMKSKILGPFRWIYSYPILLYLFGCQHWQSQYKCLKAPFKFCRCWFFKELVQFYNCVILSYVSGKSYFLDIAFQYTVGFFFLTFLLLFFLIVDLGCYISHCYL